MSDDPGQLSLKLCGVLDRIGVSEDMRNVYRDTGISNEIMETLAYTMTDVNRSQYKFGSSCEGTTTYDMGSDLDVVSCDEQYPVIEDLQDAPAGNAFLMVTSTHTEPGYVKLQRVFNGEPFTIHNYNGDDVKLQYDCEGRVCMCHPSVVGVDKDYTERNGPADTIANHPVIVSMDDVYALRCRKFPHVAEEALNKCSACGWVSREDVERMKRFGIFLVGVGCQWSKECAIEWRISFSLQERDLMFSLNPTQHKCFVLLKTVKNLITHHADVEHSLTSYHCKTCLFTIITDTSMTLWTERNLIKCTFICLSALESWIYRGNCPNFFIKDSNMFERREFKEAQERLLYYLRDILHEGPRLFYRIQSDHIGQALQGRASRQIDEKRTVQKYGILIRACEHMLHWQRALLLHCSKLACNIPITLYLWLKLRDLTSIDMITEHTQEQTQTAIRHLEPIMHKLFAQHLAAVAFTREDHVSRHRLLEYSAHHINQAKNCDRITCRLLEATILYRAGNLESCCRLLEQIESQLMCESVISFCRCYIQGFDRNFYLQEKVSSGTINQQNVMESCVVPCMIFLPCQSEIIPKALQYEMYRSVYAPFVNTNGTQWYDWVVVDSKVYLFFLQYLVYSDLQKPDAKRYAVDQMMKVLYEDPNIGHRETGYNLLGWIHIQEGQFKAAITCFCVSWIIRPEHNAAKWLMLGLLVHLNGNH